MPVKHPGRRKAKRGIPGPPKPLPPLSVVDTNVPKMANLAKAPGAIEKAQIRCVAECVRAMDHVIHANGLVLDKGDAIFGEYRGQLSLRGQPGVGDKFVKWVHDRHYSLPPENLVELTPCNDSYAEFPQHADLTGVDPADKKFIAVAHAHPKRPPIWEASDSKWYGWKEALAAQGIRIFFMDESFIRAAYEKKMGAKKRASI